MITRGALKTILLAAAGLFLITEILKELSFANSLNQMGRDSEMGRRGSDVASRRKSSSANVDVKKRQQDIENQEANLERVQWLSEVQQIVSNDKALAPLLQPFEKPFPQDSPELIQMVREKYLLAPSEEEYNIEATKDTSMGQAQLIRKILRNKHHGTFVECGALDGETRSNSLFLEMELDWSGILIEADPKSLQKIRSKHRKAWLVPACLSTRRETMQVTYGAWNNIGRIIHSVNDDDDNELDRGLEEGQKNLVNVSCIPLYSILQAFNNPTIDYFSLDVEGSELAILKTIPFDKVDIRTLSVEFFHLDEMGNSNDELKSYMEKQGYVYHSTVKARKNHANDYIFVKKHLNLDQN